MMRLDAAFLACCIAGLCVSTSRNGACGDSFTTRPPVRCGAVALRRAGCGEGAAGAGAAGTTSGALGPLRVKPPLKEGMLEPVSKSWS